MPSKLTINRKQKTALLILIESNSCYTTIQEKATHTKIKTDTQISNMTNSNSVLFLSRTTQKLFSALSKNTFYSLIYTNFDQFSCQKRFETIAYHL